MPPRRAADAAACRYMNRVETTAGVTERQTQNFKFKLNAAGPESLAQH